jgi:hypothetical protein
MKAVLIVVIMFSPGGVTSEQIAFPTMTDCRIARLNVPKFDSTGLWRDAICIEVPE